ncbi:dynein regulatory complex protein 11 isoform X2 [Halyomorpha halys]|uniref:dynein regulatory complex protein 11 isoform X2 n=1 Tax=Halyomorpha halys TaxID=286706 RepID=UPI0006D4FFB3|nr:IQ and AAA domain-containing protein 1-like isoform X2 [Halyomorpha halys]
MYLKVVNSLTEAHNGLINPIKRQSLQVIIEKLFGRILELKFEMVDVEKADFQYLDNIILQNYVTRKHVEMKIPHYLRDQRHDLLSSLYERMAQIEYRKEHPEEFMEREESEEIEERRSSLGRASAMRRTSLIGSATSEPDDGSKIKESRMSSLRDTRRQQSVTAVASKRPPVVTKIEDKFEFYDELTLLQRHERARFGRLKTHRVKEELRILHDKAYLIHKEVPDDIALKAAETIQSFYMTYKNKQWRRYLNTYKGLKYGTLMPSYRDRTVINEITKLLEERKKIQKHFETEMVKKEKEISENMQRVKKYEIMEDMVTELRAFIRAWYDYTKAFGYTEVPEWPGEEEVIPPARFLGIPEGLPKYYVNANFPEIDYAKIGLHPVLPLVGSELITAGFWIPVEQYAPAAEMERNILAKGIPKEDEEKNAQEKESEKEREEQRKEEERLKMEELMRRGHVPAKSNYLKDIIALSGEFIQYWSVGTVYTQAEDEINMLERIKSKVIYEVTREVRKDVDNQMRKELKILKAAIEKDTLEMGEPVLKIKRKKKKEKKKKAKKVKKDPLAERTVESLFDELTEEGLIIRCKPIIIDSLTGQYNFHAQEARLKYENPVPAMGDVYQVAKEFVILPLGSTIVKEKCPSIKSVLFAGPDRLTHPLVHSLAYSVGAVMIYLPALNFTKKYKTKMLINMLIKVAKAYEPTVIFIEGAEKPFYKKVPKNEKAMRPGALKGVVPKLLKAIKNVDRIMVLATAEFPWMSKPKLASVYQKVLICPESDYHCVSALVQKTILSNHGVDRQFDTSVPSAFFQGMPLNEIEDKLKAIFTVERRIRLAYNPLKIEELGCIDKEAPKDRNLEDWYNKFYPLNKGRKKMLDGEREKRERELKLKENAEKRKALSAGKAV